MRRTLTTVTTVALLVGMPLAGLAGPHEHDRLRGAGHCEKRAEKARVNARGRSEPRVDVQGIDEHGKHRRGQRFMADDLRELRIKVRWGGVSEPTAQRIELFTPSGHLYQAFAAEVDQDIMETSVPVGGTLITQYGLYGEWCLELYVEGVGSPVARKTFVLVESTKD